jgi:hypothetical protein
MRRVGMSAEEFRRLGAECLRLAQLANNEADKLALIHMAEHYRRLAHRVESEKRDPIEKAC